MIAIDWGTTNLRAYRVDDAGIVLARKSVAGGVMRTAPGAFASTLNELISPWLVEDEGPVMMCGMVGSRQGWVEVPYIPCPASARDIAAGLRKVDIGGGKSGFICPGLVSRDSGGVPDLLRGEETQIIGAMTSLRTGSASVWIPGTHCKHVHVHDGVIETFTTYMTGESFSLYCEHSILGRLSEGVAVDIDAFDEGLRRAEEQGGLLHHLFGVRSRVLCGDMAAGAVRGYLSGLLIGHEIASDPPGGDEPIFVLGDIHLAELYVRALDRCGFATGALGRDLAVAGLVRVWHAMEGRIEV